MESHIRDIPGYYYDKYKKKYFKIQKNSPAGSAYSSQDVKRRKTRDERNDERVEAEARQRGRIQRSKILKAPLAGHILQRELGLCGRYSSLDAAQIFSQGLVPRGRIDLPPTLPEPSNPLFTLDHRTDLGRSVVDVKIACSDQLFSARIDTDKNILPEYFGKRRRGFCHGNHDLIELAIDNSAWLLERYGNCGNATSLSRHETGQIVAMTWLSGSSNSGIAIASRAVRESDPEYQTPTVVLGPGVERGLEADIFSSTPAPPDSPFAFAFGSTYGILAVDKQEFRLGWIQSDRYPRQESPKDVFAVEFLADNQHILLSGGRKGILNIADLRVPSNNNDFIHHPSSITHIRQLDDHRIIVAGLNSNLCQYDLRFRRLITTVASTARKPRKSIHNQTITRSILQYSDFHNDSVIQMGFDVDLETGTVAAGQEVDGFNPPVRLFSLHGGYEVTSPRIPQDFRIKNNVRCLKFARDIEGRMKSLYVGSDAIQRFAWAELEGNGP